MESFALALAKSISYFFPWCPLLIKLYSAKMTAYWPRSFFPKNNAKKELGHYSLFVIRLFSLDARCYGAKIIRKPARPNQIAAPSDLLYHCAVSALRHYQHLLAWGSDIVQKVYFVQVVVKLSRHWNSYSLVYWLRNERIKELQSAVTVTIGTAAKWQLAKLELAYSLGFVFFSFPQDLLVRISIKLDRSSGSFALFCVQSSYVFSFDAFVWVFSVFYRENLRFTRLLISIYSFERPVQEKIPFSFQVLTCFLVL